jgi:hypothetical protein
MRIELMRAFVKMMTMRISGTDVILVLVCGEGLPNVFFLVLNETFENEYNFAKTILKVHNKQ